MTVRIGKTDLATQVYVIAEVGGNHNGDPELALRLVDEAASAGANAVKFQTYRAELLVHPDLEAMPLARARFKRQFDRFKSLELPWEAYEKIVARCRARGIDFLTTPFDLEALDQLASFMPAVKIASGDLTFHPLIERAARTGKPVILSTGMADREEIGKAAALIPAAQRILLHCVSIYPLKDELANLRAIASLKVAQADAVVGYSDHTIGIEAPLAAVALGARVIEKHFTLDSRQELGDHRLSLEPAALAGMIKSIRRIETMLGRGEVGVGEGEMEMRRMLRRGVYAARELPAGTAIAMDDLVFLRPENTTTPAGVLLLIGRRTRHEIPVLATLDESSVQ
jgi:N-acetylneuraminate synthase/N,N'-diacetyllegionaminate synthase